MAFSAAETINNINEILQEGSDNLIENPESFASHVDELLFHSWLLTKEQANFLTYLIRLKAEVSSSANIILDTEEKLAEKERVMSMLLEEKWEVEEAMIIHVYSLAAFFHEQQKIDLSINASEVENVYLKNRKDELNTRIYETITDLIVKRGTNNILMKRRRSLNREIFRLRNCMERTNEYRGTIEAWCARAIEAGRNL